MHSKTDSAIKSFEIFVQRGLLALEKLAANDDAAMEYLAQRQHAFTNFKFFDYSAASLYSPEQKDYLNSLFAENYRIQKELETNLKNLREISLSEMLKLNHSRRKLAMFKGANIDEAQILQEVG